MSELERKTGAQVLLGAAIAALAISIFNYFWTGNGIHGTAGALLVVVSSVLLAAAAAALLFAGNMGRGLRGTLVVLTVLDIVLTVLDIVGTGLAAYFLEAPWLIAAMAVALIGWILRLVSDGAPQRATGGGIAQRGAE